MSRPLFGAFTPVRRYRLGPYGAGLIRDPERVGEVQYRYILAVLRPGLGENGALYVTSEVNALGDRFGGSHFLGMFDETGHTNFGASDEWADLERFEEKALSLAAERLGVIDPPELLL